MFHSDPIDRQNHDQEPHGPNPGDAVLLRHLDKGALTGKTRT
jgi:hypothetical protein